MTAFPHAIDSAAPLGVAVAMMGEHDIRHLPVTRDGRLASIVGMNEVALALEPREGGPPPAGLTVHDVCCGDVYVVDVSAYLDDVLEEMARRHADCAVVTKENRLVGIFTATDVCRVLAGLLRDMYPSTGGDHAA